MIPEVGWGLRASLLLHVDRFHCLFHAVLPGLQTVGRTWPTHPACPYGITLFKTPDHFFNFLAAFRRRLLPVRAWWLMGTPGSAIEILIFNAFDMNFILFGKMCNALIYFPNKRIYFEFCITFILVAAKHWIGYFKVLKLFFPIVQLFFSAWFLDDRFCKSCSNWTFFCFIFFIAVKQLVYPIFQRVNDFGKLSHSKTFSILILQIYYSVTNMPTVLVFFVILIPEYNKKHHSPFILLVTILKMKKLWVFLCYVPVCILPRRRPNDYFQNPLDIPLFLSGNFGELRSNHFHSGLDIKTQQKPDSGICCCRWLRKTHQSIPIRLWEGALCATCQRLQYGLCAFGPLCRRHTKYVKENQYNKESYEIELFPNSELLKVKKETSLRIQETVEAVGASFAFWD